jgi:sRNA-binding regulator protein Hfq
MKARPSHDNVHYATNHDNYNVSLEDDGHQSNVHYATNHDNYNVSLEDDGHQSIMIEKQNL